MDHNADKYLGKRLEGRYEIQELIGTGGMANVYKAFDTIDQRMVAVKILRDEYLTNEEFLRRFKNESKAIAVLSHPNIVRVYDVSFTNRVHSIVMEYIDGITLKDYIENQGILTWKEAVHFTLQILRALQHAHEKGIVHRDIKPHNIMLLQNGTIKVTDFGIARFARSEVKTITDRAIGSVHYISPEQAMGDNTDEKSDIYSVGVMLFEMLTGKLPFEAETAVSVAIKQIQSQAVLPTELNANIPKGLEDITVRAMRKNAAQRYQSAAEMIEDIERFKQNPSIQFEYKYNNESPQARRKKYRRAISETREEEQQAMEARRRRRTPYIPILTGVTFAFVLASMAFVGLMIWLNNPFAQVPEIEVPNLVGVKFDTAKEQYAGDFELVQEEVSNSDEWGPGIIFEQNPKVGRTIRQGSTVKVKVSSGQLVVTVPNFERRPAEQALQKLEELGLVPEEKHIYHDDIPAGSVIYTDPSRDSQVNAGTKIFVYISLGPDEAWTTVPNLVGLTVDQARHLLEINNLRVGDVTEEVALEPAGTIIAQDPDSGSVQIEGTAINVIVSTGAGGDFKRIAIPVELPADVDQLVTFQAYQDGKLVQEETLNPSEVGTWRPWFTGETEEVYIEVFMDGSPYKQYELNFDTRLFQDVTGGVELSRNRWLERPRDNH
ncbi:MAG: Stk1 family PASTA domain-containing Ser/Thr kinase [Oscillospiraceae bacterium]